MKIIIEGKEALDYTRAVANGFNYIPKAVGDALESVLDDWELTSLERKDIERFLSDKTTIPF